MIKEEEIQNRRVIPDLFLGREQLRVESFWIKRKIVIRYFKNIVLSC
jgi:hypothetical protein